MSPSGPDAALDRRAELEQHARAIGVGIGDVERLVRLQVGEVGEPVGRIGDARAGERSPPWLLPPDHGRRGSAGSGDRSAAQELTPADL